MMKRKQSFAKITALLALRNLKVNYTRPEKKLPISGQRWCNIMEIMNMIPLAVNKRKK
uniref:Uncharacterized protein n=1 Tax=Arundo donax TaxID=35708 RepID=A0A0A8YBA5_ARUDO